MQDTLVIDRRFRGPPDSGNGGYSCGMLGVMIGEAAEVTLRSRPPLETPLQVSERTGGGLVASHEGEMVIEASPADPGLEIPGVVSMDDAMKASARYEGFTDHAFPACFVCGPERAEADGLRIFAGELETPGCAAPWTPHPSVADGDGVVRPEIVCAALDCPTGWSTYYAARDAGLSLLGRLTARIIRPVEVGKSYVVAAWPERRDGRKSFATSAILSAEGELHAVSRAVWIELRT